MRIPGSRPVTDKLVRAFEITDRDVRVIRRGVKDVKATAVGAVSGYVASGGDFLRDPKGAAAFVVASAAAAMIGKKTRENISASSNGEETP